MENTNLMENTPTTNQTLWSVDTVHSNLKFSVSHLVISEVEGEFKSYQANIAANTDFTELSVDMNIDVKSINTNNEMRDGHLLSDDFFNAEQFPNIRFLSTQLIKQADNTFILKGDLTLREVTKTIDLKVQYKGQTKDGYGNTKAAFKVSGSINRFDFGLKWNALTEAGGLTVGEKVNFNLNLQILKMEQK